MLSKDQKLNEDVFAKGVESVVTRKGFVATIGIVVLGIVAIAGVLLVVFLSGKQESFVDNIKFKGVSMSPTIEDKEVIEYDISIQTDGQIEPNQIIIVEIDDYFTAKRVAGIPGDELNVENGDLIVNGAVFEFPGGGRVQGGPFFENGSRAVPDGSYFVIGDNPDKSRDSRAVGFIERGEIVGIVNVEDVK